MDCLYEKACIQKCKFTYMNDYNLLFIIIDIFMDGFLVNVL